MAAEALQDVPAHVSVLPVFQLLVSVKRASSSLCMCVNSLWRVVGGVCVGPFISGPPVPSEGVTKLTLPPVCAFRSHPY